VADNLRRETEPFVTTPHGSRAGGFWNDTGVSSHTDSSAHAHKWALLTDCESHGTQNVGTLVLLPARTISRGTAETLLSCQFAENYPSVLFEERKSGNGSPPAGGAADIPIAEACLLYTFYKLLK
jgi:hypothetical protein